MIPIRVDNLRILIKRICKMNALNLHINCEKFVNESEKTINKSNLYSFNIMFNRS